MRRRLCEKVVGGRLQELLSELTKQYLCLMVDVRHVSIKCELKCANVVLICCVGASRPVYICKGLVGANKLKFEILPLP